MAKHDAWAAASSSSGEVRPSTSSVRDAHDTGRSVKSSLEPALTVPAPSANVPVQVTVAVLVAAIGAVSFVTLGPG